MMAQMGRQRCEWTNNDANGPTTMRMDHHNDADGATTTRMGQRGTARTGGRPQQESTPVPWNSSGAAWPKCEPESPTARYRAQPRDLELSSKVEGARMT